MSVRDILLTFIALSLLVALAQGQLHAGRLTPEEETNITVYRQNSSSVVNITTTTLIRDFFSIYPQKGSGSGSIISADGYVLTNAHVIEDATEISITMTDGKKYHARFIGADPDNDIAVIKIISDKPASFKAMELGNSDELQVGQRVYAIGNPFGLNSTLTTGIISALSRPLTIGRGRVIENVIQTDTTINPGNSGGPLIDTSGRMIGINSAIFTLSGGSVGIGFAVPINTAKMLIPDLIKYGKVKRPWIGIVGVPLWEKLARALELPVDKGILVSQVVKGSPAYRAGIKGGFKAVDISNTVIYLGGDVILEVNDVKVSLMQDMVKALSAAGNSKSVPIRILRGKDIIKVNCSIEFKT
ncbi:DegP2 peptidase [Candidatus Magnetobacterium bavaricum]|uniref:DegP2 peptidase n=1 Tax=Candidatus Magnetobacterium bavaricum TaxID=29290 RepID=A0A0F3GKC3_9BACT|nr:DegP2 peptidase [Candidatus Magnetobacterium bavaricum]